jgi:carboxylesterase type B
MFYPALVIFALILRTSDALHFRNPDIVRTENGWVTGERRGNYYAFEGLRYAAPPVGENRFQPPKPYTKYWRGTQNATWIRPFCIHWNPFAPGTDKIQGDEDCLFVNVYKPTKKPYRGYKFPVIVHIHAGAFQFGDGAFFGPVHIMSKENFVYVSFNYRLGIFGFLSTKSSVVPGNMGLKDQVMALKWVQRNIGAFDGDVDSITLTGFSAGAASVHLHYMSPLSAGLFHRGISHSGVAIAEWVLMKNPVQKMMIVAEHIGCLNTDQQEMVDCLKTKPAPELVWTTIEQIGSTVFPLVLTFGVVVEEEHSGAFITMTPREYLDKGRVQALPWLTSVTMDEGLLFTPQLYSDHGIEYVNSDWNLNTARMLHFNSTEPKVRNQLATELKSIFFDNQPLSKDNFHQLTKVSWG